MYPRWVGLLKGAPTVQRYSRASVPGQGLPGGRVLFQDVRLAFFRGAKIGVLGVNGSGKSCLLKIIAGKA
jgi:ABC-type polysaccharide/polyol phosphate transport system ATPase subunit